MKKILLISCGGLGNGGVQQVIMNIVRNLSSDYIFDIVVFTDKYTFFNDEFLKYGGNIICDYDYYGSNYLRRGIDYYIRGIRKYKSIKRIIDSNGPYHAIHCHNDYEAALYVKAAKEKGIPIRITHFHRIIDHPKRPIKKQINNFYGEIISKNSTILAGCSRKCCDNAYGTENISYVIYNPCDLRRFKYIDNTDTRKDGIINIIQVASFSDNKNQIFTLRVIKKILEENIDVRLRLVGFEVEKGYKKRILESIKDLKLQDNVIFYPDNADIPNLIGESHYLITPSRMEGFGMVLIEAQAVGRRCFASDSIPKETNCGGVNYISLKDGEEVWSRKIIEDFRMTKGGSVKYDCSAFSCEKVMDKYRVLYEGRINAPIENIGCND